MDIVDWDHIEWAASVEKTRNLQPRDFEDYKFLAGVAVSLRAEITQLRAELAQAKVTYGAAIKMTHDKGVERVAALEAEIEQERELADRCYAELLTWTGGECEMYQQHEIELVSLYRTRRNK